jgi:hypothetical protein
MGAVEVAGGWGKRIPEPKLKLKHYQNKKKVKKKRIDSPGPVQVFFSSLSATASVMGAN